MSAFAVLKSDDKVFANDKIRFDATASFLTPDDSWEVGTQQTPLPSHEISFDDGDTWIDISEHEYIDYAFATAADYDVVLRVTADSGSVSTIEKTVTVIDPTTTILFSKDSDLETYEPEINRYLPKKWSSWNLVHLRAQEFILQWLDETRVYKADGTNFTADDFGDHEQVKQLSCYKTLEIIYEGLSNVVGDIFSLKRDKYKSLVIEKLNRANLKLDYDGSGAVDTNERIDLYSGELTRG